MQHETKELLVLREKAYKHYLFMCLWIFLAGLGMPALLIIIIPLIVFLLIFFKIATKID